MGNKKRKGIWIIEEIIKNKNLDWPNKVLLTEIYSLCKLEEGCIASDNHFGELLDMGRSSINKRINWLKKNGYIITKNHYQDKLCIGRTITKGSSVEKHTLVPEEDNGSSQKTLGVVLKNDKDSSVENTINSSNNSDLTIQETIQNTGGSIFSALEIKYEELVISLVEKSSLREDITYYTIPETLGMYRAAVNEQEYKNLYPVLKNLVEIGKKLDG